MRDSLAGKQTVNSNIENNVSINSKPYHPSYNLGVFKQKSCQEGGRFAHLSCSKELGFDRSWKVAKTQYMGLIPT